MKQYEEKNGQGVAFLKDKLSEKYPDWTGYFLTPSGEKLQIALWEKNSAKGVKYLSINVSEPFEKKNKIVTTTEENNNSSEDYLNDLPY